MNILKKISGSVGRKFSSVDLVIILCFAVFASLYQINRTSGNSMFLFHNSDGANIAGIAAAYSDPELFTGDQLLGNPNNSRFYISAHILWAKVISKITGDYASPFTLLVGLHIFILMLGFYILGRVLFRSRFWALLLAVLNAAPVNLSLGEFWGIYYDSLPRLTLQAVLPYLLAAVFYWRFKPKVWPWILASGGFLMYVYALGVPCWILSIWMGFWLFLPDSWSIFKRAGFMLFLGICFLAGASPYLFTYFSNHIHGAVNNYPLIAEIVKYRFPKGFLDAGVALWGFLANPTFLRVLVFGLAGITYMWFYYRAQRRNIALIFMWIFGILITSLIIPFAEQVFTRAYKTIPFEVNFSRNLKYLFPLMLIFCLWPFAVITNNSTGIKKKRLVFILGFLLVFVWSSRQMYKHIRFLNQDGYFLLNPDKTRAAETMDMLNAIKRLTLQESRFLVLSSFFPELAVRYYALRPLVFAGKDGGPLYYSNHSELIKWYEKARDVNKTALALRQAGNDSGKIKIISELSNRLNAEYLLIDRSRFSDGFVLSQPGVVYFNNLYLLIKGSAFKN
jgi:hypothetical protein